MIENSDMVIARLREEIKAIGSLRKWAKVHDFSPSYISHVLTGREAVAKRLGTELGFEVTPAAFKESK